MSHGGGVMKVKSWTYDVAFFELLLMSQSAFAYHGDIFLLTKTNTDWWGNEKFATSKMARVRVHVDLFTLTLLA